MNLARLYAFAVTPARTGEDVPAPTGGVLKVNAEIRAALDEAFVASKLAQESTIDFRMDTDTRQNDVRDLVMTLAFESAKAKAAAQSLANRLAGSMDDRSPNALFVLAISEEADSRRVTLWAFPREDAFQFRDGSKGPTVKLLSDVFSQTSRLRKAALFEGRKLKTDFLSGRVLDLQSRGSFGGGANFWIERFLNCKLGLDGDLGTKMLADCLRKVHQATDDPDEKEQLNTAMVAVRTSPKRRWSVKKFAREYLQGPVRQALIDSAPNQDAANDVFDFNREVFEKSLNFRVFRLGTEVIVSAPFGEVGQSVQISGQEERWLSCEGPIVEEKVRARRA